MNRIPEKCPICEEGLVVTEIFCPSCTTTFTGQFETQTSPLSRLNAKQLEFILTFIRCEGKFNRMEEELGISYPTLRNRFNEILLEMGIASSEGADSEEMKIDRMEILQALRNGEIDPSEAESRLNGLAA